MLQKKGAAESLLTESITDPAALLNTLCEHSSDLIARIQADGTIHYTSPSFRSVLGYAAGALYRQPILDLVPPAERSGLQTLLIRQAAHADPKGPGGSTWDGSLLNQAGQFLSVQLCVLPLSDDSLLLIGSKRSGGTSDSAEVSREDTLAEKLRESEQKYRTLVESAGEAIAVVDHQGTFLFMNSIAALRLGGEPETYIGRTMTDLFPPSTAGHQMGTVRAVLKSQEGRNVISQTEVRGEKRWYNTTVVPLQERPGKRADKVLIIGRDIDKLKRAEQEVARYREDMIRAEHLASLGTLSATAAHELNQPLTVIRLALENALAGLRSDGLDRDGLVELLDEALAEMENTAGIVTRFRRFARRSTDRRVAVHCLREIIAGVIDLMHHSAQQRRVDLVCEHGTGPLPIRCDRNALTQVFFSLIQNGIQAAQGSQGHRVEVTIKPAGAVLEVVVADDCGGIAPQQVDHIFDPFFTTKSDGTGLGLCLVRRLVEETGGQIRVQSEWGQGSRFVLTLPSTTEGAREAGSYD